MLNLAVNARDAMPQGGRLMLQVSIESLDEASVRAVPGATAGTWACLSVSDTGSGVSPQALPHIFEPFYTTKPPGKGTGLGLATVHGIIRQHGGHVCVDTALGRGTTFKVLLPLVTRVPAAEAEAAHVVSSSGGGGEALLVVEDEPAVRRVLRNILERSGYELVIAENGKEALEAFAQHAERIALLLTDVVMPDGLTGADVLEQLRAQNPKLKSILSSGYGVDVLGERFVPQEGVMFLQKPYKAEELLRQIRRLLDES